MQEGGPSRAAVVGAGYVGIATAVGLAEQGRDIVLVEQDPEPPGGAGRGPHPVPRARVARSVCGPARGWADRVDRGDPREGLDIVVVCVGTPIDDVGFADTSHVAQALDQAAPAIAAGRRLRHPEHPADRVGGASR